MKNALFLFFFCSGFLLQSQSYVPLLDNQNEWQFTTCYEGVCLKDTYYTDGDTLVNGFNHKILDGYHYISRSFLLREDVSTKKVYLTIINPTRIEENLLYDFSLEEGDTFDMKNPITPFPFVAGEYVLDSIRQRPMFDDEFRRFFYFSPAENNQISTNNAVWVEGVGSLSLINAPSGLPDQNGVGLLQCFFKNGILFYADLDAIVPVCVPFLLNYQNFTLEALKFQLSKNEKILHIQNAQEVNQIEIYSLSGQRITTYFSHVKEEIKIPFQSYSEGLYLLRIQFVDGHFKSFKISY